MLQILGCPGFVTISPFNNVPSEWPKVADAVIEAETHLWYYSMWINRHKLNNSLAIFIHGILGNRWATWKGIPDLLQYQFPTDPNIRSYDIYLFQYETAFLRQPFLNPDVVDDLDHFLRRISRKYQTVIFISHSQGGILAKLYILKKLLNDEGQSLIVDKVITLGTPHKGIFILNFLLFLQKIPLIKIFFPFRQFGQLASWSKNIRTLKQQWTDTYISCDPCQPVARRRHVKSIAVVGAYDRWVNRRSASGFPVDTVKYLPLGHPSLAKSNSPSERLTEIIFDELREHLYPESIINSLTEIRAYPTKRDAYLKHYNASVADIVQRMRPELSGDAFNYKVASILIDFAYNFRERPLRSDH